LCRTTRRMSNQFASSSARTASIIQKTVTPVQDWNRSIGISGCTLWGGFPVAEPSVWLASRRRTEAPVGPAPRFWRNPLATQWVPLESAPAPRFLWMCGCHLKNIVAVFQWPRKAGSFAWHSRCNRRLQLCITSLSSDPGGRSPRDESCRPSVLSILPNRRRLKPQSVENSRWAKGGHSKN